RRQRAPDRGGEKNRQGGVGGGSSSFRDGPKDQTSDVKLHIGESRCNEHRDSGFASIGPRFARTRWTRPGMTLQYHLNSTLTPFHPCPAAGDDPHYPLV